LQNRLSPSFGLDQGRIREQTATLVAASLQNKSCKNGRLVRESCAGTLPLKFPRDGFAGHLNLTNAQKRIATLLGGDAWVHSLGKMTGTELTWPVSEVPGNRFSSLK